MQDIINQYQVIQNTIFIMGCERSGTTFLGSLIGSHSECIVTPESQFKTDCYSNKEKSSFVPEKAFTKIKNRKRFQYWDSDISFTISELNEIKNYSDLLLRIVQKYNIHISHKKTAKIWIDHTPQNTEDVDTLKELFPNAKFIHIIRDGRAVASSHQKLSWGPKGMKNMATYWLKKLALGFAYEVRYPNDVLSIKYEDLLTDTETTVKKVTDFIGIGYEENMLKADGLIVPQYTKHQHTLVGKKASTDRIHAWQKNLSKREIELFERESKNMLNLLGYNILFPNAKRENRYERILYRIKYNYIRFMNKRKKL